jgi:mannose-6-phosphate isomerase-like protein (cupin superfamily)
MTTTPLSTLHVTRTQLDRSVWYAGYLLTFLANGEETGGRFSLVEEVGRRGMSAEPPLHMHTREEECFYVLEGCVRFYVGNEVIEATRGTFVMLPRGVPHRFTLESNEVRMLNLCSPAGFEGFLKELSEPAQALTLPPAPDGPPDVERLLSAAVKYGVEIVGPPPA